MGFYPSEIPSMLPALLRGLEITVVATFLVMAIALVAGLPVALARMSNVWLLRHPPRSMCKSFAVRRFCSSSSIFIMCYRSQVSGCQPGRRASPG